MRRLVCAFVVRKPPKTGFQIPGFQIVSETYRQRMDEYEYQTKLKDFEQNLKSLLCENGSL